MPIGLGDYKPTSLIGSLYKIITKVLPLRLKPLLSKIFDETQSTFVGGRQIQRLADDTIILMEPNFKNIITLKCIVDGLKLLQVLG